LGVVKHRLCAVGCWCACFQFEVYKNVGAVSVLISPSEVLVRQFVVAAAAGLSFSLAAVFD
jgi:hypothetical protein